MKITEKQMAIKGYLFPPPPDVSSVLRPIKAVG